MVEQQRISHLKCFGNVFWPRVVICIDDFAKKILIGIIGILGIEAGAGRRALLVRDSEAGETLRFPPLFLLLALQGMECPSSSCLVRHDIYLAWRWDELCNPCESEKYENNRDGH